MNSRTALLIAVSVVLSACATTTSESDIDGLDGTSWVLTTMPGVSVAAGSSVTLHFDEGRITGTDGCNRLSGTYTAGAVDLQIAGNLARTMMACPERIMSQADTFIGALGAVTSYRIVAGQLLLFSADDKMLASLAPEARGIVGTSWYVTGYNNGKVIVSLLPGTSLTVEFARGGTASGSSGCNNYTAGYTTSGSALTIGRVATTRKLCAGSNIMEQEQKFLDALASSATFRQEGNNLELRRADDALAMTLGRDTSSTNQNSAPVR